MFFIINLVAFAFYIISVVRFSIKYDIEKGENDTLNRQLTGHLTDFERLILIVKIFGQVDFEKLSPDQKKDWENFVKNNMQKNEK